MAKIAGILKEPEGKTYSDLIRFGAQYCSSFSLVWGDQHVSMMQNRGNYGAQLIENKLKPYLIKEEYTNKWPGTELLGHKAKVRFYQFNRETVRILQEVESLYNWSWPNKPEDLAFYSKNGKCVLGSIAHEGDSFIYSDEIPLETIKKEIPELEIKIIKSHNKAIQLTLLRAFGAP